MVVLLSTSASLSANTCFMYVGDPVLGAQITAGLTSSCWIAFFIIVNFIIVNVFQCLLLSPLF